MLASDRDDAADSYPSCALVFLNAEPQSRRAAENAEVGKWCNLFSQSSASGAAGAIPAALRTAHKNGSAFTIFIPWYSSPSGWKCGS